MAAPAGYRVSALDIRRLSLFLAVVEHDGFTRAATAVHISQPALSQAIAELEAELGGPLVLAGAGAAVMPEAMAGLATARGAIAVPFDPPLMRDLAIVHRPGPPTPAAAAFLAVAARLAR